MERILYINLDHRTDRRESIESVLTGFKYERIPAIKHQHGYIGAYLSHIKALEHAISKNYRHVLIIEDDMLWNDFDKNYAKLKVLMSKHYDVIVLGGILVSHDPSTHKLYQCNSAGAYLVNGRYMRKLLQHFQRGLMNFNKTFKSGYLLDVYWHALQKSDTWYILPMCYSNEDYSDVSGKIVNWKPYFLT